MRSNYSYLFPLFERETLHKLFVIEIYNPVIINFNGSKKFVMPSKNVFSFSFLVIFASTNQIIGIMKIYKWLRGLLSASALTTVMFIMQACYGTPMREHRVQMSGVVVDKMTGLPLKDIEYRVDGHIWGYTDENGQFDVLRYDEIYVDHQLSFIDSVGRYQTFDTLIRDYDVLNLKIKLESN